MMPRQPRRVTTRLWGAGGYRRVTASRAAQLAAAGVEELVRGLGAQPQLARVFGSEEGFGARRTRFRKTQ
jgi:hypothetical protein